MKLLLEHIIVAKKCPIPSGWGHKLFTHLMESSRRKYETGIAALATSTPKVFFIDVRRNHNFDHDYDSWLNVGHNGPEETTEGVEWHIEMVTFNGWYVANEGIPQPSPKRPTLPSIGGSYLGVPFRVALLDHVKWEGEKRTFGSTSSWHVNILNAVITSAWSRRRHCKEWSPGRYTPSL